MAKQGGAASRIWDDVRTVRQYAMAVILIKKDSIEVQYRAKPKLSVIAIVGPGTHEGVTYEESLLMEVGVRRGRPYRRTNALRRPWSRRRGRKVRKLPAMLQKYLPKRKRLCMMDEVTYRRVAPILFSVIRVMAEKIDDKRDSGSSRNPYWKKHDRTLYYKSHKVLHVVRTLPYVSPVCFTADESDTWFLRDVLWAERHQSEDVASARRFLRYIDKMLSGYRAKRPKRKNFWTLKFAAEAEKSIRSSEIPYHIQIDALRKFLAAKRNHPVWYVEELKSVFYWDGEHIPREISEAEAALSDPQGRINGLKPRTDGLRKGRLVFEIILPPQYEWKGAVWTAAEIETKETEEVPRDEDISFPFGANVI